MQIHQQEAEDIVFLVVVVSLQVTADLRMDRHHFLLMLVSSTSRSSVPAGPLGWHDDTN